MAVHLQTTMLIHRKSITYWPQIRLQSVSFQLECKIAEQRKATVYTSCPSCTPFGLRPDTRNIGLMRAKCPSEITIFSYLFWVPDQAKEVLIFAGQ